MLDFDGHSSSVDYEPGESTSDLFGGNSNWRGPVWFPMNFLLMESMQRINYYYGNEFQVEFPTGSGRRRICGTRRASWRGGCRRFFCGATGGGRFLAMSRCCRTILTGAITFFSTNILTGIRRRGCASHQTGWTALVAKLLEQSGE